MSTDNVIPIGCLTTLPIDPNKVLNAAVDKLDFVFIAGIDKNDNFYFAASEGKLKDVLWLLEACKFKMMRGDFDD